MRHPLKCDLLFLMVEYDVTALYDAPDEVESARVELQNIVMKDTLTGVFSLHSMQWVSIQANQRIKRNRN